MNSKTRRSVLIAAAAGAGLAGASLAWFRQAASPNADSNASADIWQVQAPTPSGAFLKLSDFKGKPLILNFWATWCPPCIEELPLLSGFHAQHQKTWSVLGLAADQPSSVTKFLERMPLQMPIGIMGLEATNLSRQLGNDRGGLPFTVAFDSQGNAVRRKIGQITSSDLDQWIKEVR